MDLVLGERRRVRQSLAHVLLLQIWSDPPRPALFASSRAASHCSAIQPRSLSVGSSALA